MHDIGLNNLCRRRSGIQSRSISAENPRGEKAGGARSDPTGQVDHPARELGVGWKALPCIYDMDSGASVELMDVAASGVIRHIWMTVRPESLRDLVLRCYWDDEPEPSVETPLGDFFCVGWNSPADIMSLPINVNPHGGLNCYLPMPFRRRARITIENIGPVTIPHVFYTIDYTLEDIGDDALTLHAQWRRENPTEYGREYTLLDGVSGAGHYVGSFLSWQQNTKRWWGEGEIKMFIDGDDQYPTICGTGTEDYFCGAWGFTTPKPERKTGVDPARNFTAPYAGFLKLSGEAWKPGCRMVMYRFHVPDPIFFEQDLRVRIQALGWRDQGRYNPLRDDIASVAYWYQTEPHQPFLALPGRDMLEII